MLLDRIDFDLLRLLRKNARMPNKDLAPVRPLMVQGGQLGSHYRYANIMA